MPVIPAPLEGVAGGLLVPGGGGGSVLRFCKHTPAWFTEQDSVLYQKKKKKKERKRNGKREAPR